MKSSGENSRKNAKFPKCFTFRTGQWENNEDNINGYWGEGVRWMEPPMKKNLQEICGNNHAKLINLISFRKFHAFLREFGQTYKNN